MIRRSLLYLVLVSLTPMLAAEPARGSCTEVTSFATINNGVLHHVAATYDGSTMRVYVDGTLSNSTGLAGFSNIVAGGKLVIGNSTIINNGFDGVIDEVRVWNYARSQAQIQSAMNGEISGATTGLVGYWRMNGTGADEVSGNTMVPHLGASYSAGQLGQGADIPPGGYFQAAALPAYNVGGALTIECWARIRTMPGQDPRIMRCIGPVEGPCPAPSVHVWEISVCHLSCTTPGTIGFALQENSDPVPPATGPIGGMPLLLALVMGLGGVAAWKLAVGPSAKSA